MRSMYIAIHVHDTNFAQNINREFGLVEKRIRDNSWCLQSRQIIASPLYLKGYLVGADFKHAGFRIVRGRADLNPTPRAITHRNTTAPCMGIKAVSSTGDCLRTITDRKPLSALSSCTREGRPSGSRFSVHRSSPGYQNSAEGRILVHSHHLKLYQFQKRQECRQNIDPG